MNLRVPLPQENSKENTLNLFSYFLNGKLQKMQYSRSGTAIECAVKVQNSVEVSVSKRKKRNKKIREKDKDLLNNYLVSMIFYDIKSENGQTETHRQRARVLCAAYMSRWENL